MDEERRAWRRRVTDRELLEALRDMGVADMKAREREAFPELMASYVAARDRRVAFRKEILGTATVVGGFSGIVIEIISHLWR